MPNTFPHMKLKRDGWLLTWGSWLFGAVLVCAFFIAIDLPYEHGDVAMYALWGLVILVVGPVTIWRDRRGRRRGEQPQKASTRLRPRNVALVALAVALALLVLSC